MQPSSRKQTVQAINCGQISTGRVIKEQNLIGFKSYISLSKNMIQFGTCRVHNNKEVIPALGFELDKRFIFIDKKKSKPFMGMLVNRESGFALYQDYFLCIGEDILPGGLIGKYYLVLFRVNNASFQFIDAIESTDPISFGFGTDKLVKLTKPIIEAQNSSTKITFELTKNGLKEITVNGDSTGELKHQSYIIHGLTKEKVKSKIDWPKFNVKGYHRERNAIRQAFLKDLGDDAPSEDMEIFLSLVDINGDGQREFLAMLQDGTLFGTQADTDIWIFQFKNNKIANKMPINIGTVGWIDEDGDQEQVGIVRNQKKGWNDILINSSIYREFNGKYKRFK
jgi:hypothetical protein